MFFGGIAPRVVLITIPRNHGQGLMDSHNFFESSSWLGICQKIGVWWEILGDFDGDRESP